MGERYVWAMRGCANRICILHHGPCLLVLDKIRTLSPLLSALFLIHRVRVFERMHIDRELQS